MSERVIGYRQRQDGAVEVLPWTPPTPEAAAARPPLPEPPARPAPQRGSKPVSPPTSAPESAAARVPAETATPPEPRPRPPRPAWIADDSIEALVWEHPEAAAALVRMTLQGTWPREVGEPPLAHAALWLVALGNELAGEVYKWLQDPELETLTEAMATIGDVPADQERKVREFFGRFLRPGAGLKVGGVDFARAALQRACGPRKAREILDRVVERRVTGFQDLRDLAPDMVASFITHEHPQTVALVLSQLEPGQAAAILAHLPVAQQNEVAVRIATMESVTPDVIQELDESLGASLRKVVGGTLAAGGAKVLADMINMASPDTERRLLEHMDATDGELAEGVRTQMFTYADIEKLSDADLKALLDDVDADSWAVALKATHESLKAKLQALAGEETWRAWVAAMESLGPMRASEVEQVQLGIVRQLRRLEEHGTVTIVRGDTSPWV